MPHALTNLPLPPLPPLPSVVDIAQALAFLAPITLDQVGDASLMSRTDRKYALPLRDVLSVLAECGGTYRALEIGGARLHRYGTRYFDTGDLALYHAHHAGRPVRAKVRLRSYLDSDLHFVELKRRAHGGRTNKVRVEVPDADLAPQAVARAVRSLAEDGVIPDGELHETVIVAYRRCTLVRCDLPERVTIDVALELHAGTRRITFPLAAFVEVKQPVPAPSPLENVLRARGARPGCLSKYCLGVAALVPHVRTNRFKPALARLQLIGAA